MNKNLTPGSKYTFTYPIDETNKMIMTETIEKVNLPKEIITIYEVDKVWNRCVNLFSKEGEKTLVRMLVEFAFEDETGIVEENFHKKTKRQLDDFRDIVQRKYKEDYNK
jgi:hypothetical protein